MEAFLLRSSIVLLVFLNLETFAFPTDFPSWKSRNEGGALRSLRLPNDTRPISYNIDLKTRVDQSDLSFTGRVIINLEVLNETSEVVVHARKLEIKNISLRRAFPIPDYFTIEHTYDNVTEFLTIKATNRKLIHDFYVLTIDYAGQLRMDNAGFYFSNYTDENNNVINIATTQFEPTNARHAFPCYDEPAKKAVFKITITHGPSNLALSNMPVIEGPTDNGDGTVTTKFQQSTLMSTYLVAFVISNFEYSELQGRIPQRIYSRIGTKMDQNFALDASAKILEAFEEYLGIKYSLPKLDSVAIPDFASGAMENWGLITYREEVLLFNDSHSTTLTQGNIVGVMSHELAHQWFGNLVSPYWWTFLWLNEGFATMLTYIGSDMVFPEWDLWQRFHVEMYQSALAADSKLNSRPLTHYVATPNEIISVFDVISYSKGACVLHMIRHAITDAVFREVLKDYLRNQEYSAAEEDDLFKSFQTAVDIYQPFGKVDINVFQMFKSWTNQGGYPLVTVTRDYLKGSFVVKQSPFDGTNQSSSSDKKSWWIPFNFATARRPDYEETTPYTWLSVGEESKEILPDSTNSWVNDDWILLNKKTTGYYRVNYDLYNWKLLTSALISNPRTFHVHNRAQLLDDAYALVLSKHLNLKTFLDLTVYLKNEFEYAPWVTANGYLTKFNMYLEGDADYNLFQYYVGKLVGKFYTALGMTEKDNDKHLVKLSRNHAVNWSCQANYGDCVEQASNRLKDFVINGKKIEPNMRASIFCNGLKKAGEAEYNFMLQKLMESKDQAFRNLLLTHVMGCMQNTSLLTRYLHTAIQFDSSINYKTEERINLLPAVAMMGSMQLELALDFLIDNHLEYNTLPALYRISPLVPALQRIAARIVTPEQNMKFEKLLSTLSEYKEIENFKETWRASVKANLEWISEYRAELIEWLVNFKQTEEGNGSEGEDGASVVAASTWLILIPTVITFKLMF